MTDTSTTESNLEIIDNKVSEALAIPAGSPGRRLELGGKDAARLTKAQREAMLTVLFTDIQARVGNDAIVNLPALALDQLCVMSVMKGHDTAGMLKSLVNSFVTAYCTPETSDRAYELLEQLEGLRKEVADSRPRTSTSKTTSSYDTHKGETQH